MAAHVDRENAFPQTENGLSALHKLLPDLDLSNVYNSINHDVGIVDNLTASTNRTAFSTKLQIFLCPSDDAEAGRFGPCNYAGNTGVGYSPNRLQVARKGPFGGAKIYTPKKTLSSVKDGTSNTGAISEFCRNTDWNIRHPKKSVFKVGENLAYAEFLDRCARVDLGRTPVENRLKGESWLLEAYANTLYNHNMTPNAYTCTNLYESLGAWTVSSDHGRGVNLLYLDGRVSFVKDSIGQEPWQALGTMAGSEIVQATE